MLTFFLQNNKNLWFLTYSWNVVICIYKYPDVLRNKESNGIWEIIRWKIWPTWISVSTWTVNDVGAGDNDVDIDSTRTLHATRKKHE